jgi:hypothetical protein
MSPNEPQYLGSRRSFLTRAARPPQEASSEATNLHSQSIKFIAEVACAGDYRAKQEQEFPVVMIRRCPSFFYTRAIHFVLFVVMKGRNST